MSSKFSTFMKKEVGWNSVVSFSLITSFTFFLAGIIGIGMGAADSTGDFIKLFLVWANIFLLMVLLFQKKILTFGANWMKAAFAVGILSVNALALFNLSILVLNSNKGEEEGTSSGGVLNFNYDFITLGITLVTDVLYLGLYAIFRSSRAIIITLALIFVEIIIFAVCADLPTDDAVDIANYVISFTTCTMAVMLWSAKVVLNNDGNPLEFKDYFQRDDLEEMPIV